MIDRGTELVHSSYVSETTAEILRLKAERDKLREALKELVECDDAVPALLLGAGYRAWRDRKGAAWAAARAALAGTTTQPAATPSHIRSGPAHAGADGSAADPTTINADDDPESPEGAATRVVNKIMEQHGESLIRELKQNAATINEAGGVGASTCIGPQRKLVGPVRTGDELHQSRPNLASPVQPEVAPGPASPQDDALPRRLQSVADGMLTAAPTVRLWCREAADRLRELAIAERETTRLNEHITAMDDELAAAYARIDNICKDAETELLEAHAKTAAALTEYWVERDKLIAERFAAESRAKALHNALRGICTVLHGRGSKVFMAGCDLCGQRWPDGPEQHKDACLAAPEGSV